MPSLSGWVCSQRSFRDYSNKPVKSTASQSPSAKPLPANIKSRKGRK